MVYFVGVTFRLLSQGHTDLDLFAPHELSDFLTHGRVAGAGGWERYCHGLARQLSLNKEGSIGAQQLELLVDVRIQS